MKNTTVDKERVFDIIEDIISSCGSAQSIVDHLDDLLLGYIEAGAEKKLIMDRYLCDVVYSVYLLKNGLSEIGQIIRFDDTNKSL